MPLYSSDALSKATGQHDGAGGKLPAERVDAPLAGCTSWCYLFAHHARVAAVEATLRERFRTFVHRTTVYKKDSKKVRGQERPTISGLVFVQGDKAGIQQFLDERLPGLRLATDCSTKATAVITDERMRPFMQLDPCRNRIRLMPHPIGYYSEGHPLVKVTRGLLAGFEGYVVRISRNKCLVTSMGGITVAISGVGKASLDEAARLEGRQHAGAQPIGGGRKKTTLNQ